MEHVVQRPKACRDHMGLHTFRALLLNQALSEGRAFRVPLEKTVVSASEEGSWASPFLHNVAVTEKEASDGPGSFYVPEPQRR